MNTRTAKNALKKIIVKKGFSALVRRTENHPFLHGEEDLFFDIFNTGLVINVKRTAKKYYPAVISLISDILQGEMKKWH
jgi:hypothetical protein